MRSRFDPARVIEYSASVHDDHRSPAAADVSGSVTLRRLVVRCGGGDCPTVYETDRGTLVVQGYVVQPNEAGLTLPPGEQLVEVPIALLQDYLIATS